jgi:hypothetical protein
MFETFGNKVKVKYSLATIEKGLAGKTGEIYGETIPSLLNLEFVGSPKEDYAVNVYFDDLQDSFWFDVDLIEVLDEGQGAEITLNGIDKKWIKVENGKWMEIDTSSPTHQPEIKSAINDVKPGINKKWWRFWEK